MKVDLEVIASTSIKRHKPCARIIWVGTEQQSLFLLDKGRINVLYIPSGKTKRKIPQLSSIVPDTVCMTVTLNGGHLVGLQQSGEVFLWNKDRDKLKIVCGLASLLDPASLSEGVCQVFASSDCNKILVVIHHSQLFLWQHDTSHTYVEGKDHTLIGHWTKISPPQGMLLPGLDCQEASLHAMFASSSILGDCCELSLVFNTRANLTICSVLIRFTPVDDSADSSYPAIESQWKCLQYPLHNISQGCEAINIHGAYVTCYTSDASILAVAVNQKSPADTSMLYVSPLTDTLLLASMRGCGIRDPQTKRGKQYWVSDMAWTSDSLFLACMLANGSSTLLSRLGEPLVIATHGWSVDMGPAYFLPLHPLITIQGDKPRGAAGDQEFEESSTDDAQSSHQIFSVSSHPSLPIFVFSDGYMVTFAQLPGDLNTFVFMRHLVLESSRYLKQVGEAHNLDLTLPNAYNLPSFEERVKSSPRRPKSQSTENKHFSFEDLDVSLNETVDSEVSAVFSKDTGGVAKFGAIENLSSGKIVFGEPDLMQTVLDVSDLRGNEGDDKTLMKLVVSAKHSLLLVWKLAASTTEAWTANVDEVVKRAAENLVKLFSVILDCPPVSAALELQQQARPSPDVQTASLFQVISLYRHILEVAQFDALQQHLAPALLQLAHRTLTTILDSSGLQQCDPRLKTLSGCFTLLKFTERTLNKLYVWLPKSVHTDKAGRKMNPQARDDEFEPQAATQNRLHEQEDGSAGDRVDGGLAFDTGQLMAKRLAGSWKTLYKAVLSFQQTAAGAEDQQHTRQLLFAIQECLQAVNASIPQTAALPINKGDKLSLDGKHTLAMNAWREQLKQFQETGDETHAAKLLHSLLYTHLLKVDLLAAVELIDSLVVQANVLSALSTHTLTETPPIEPSFMTFVTNTLKSQALHEPDMVPCIRDKAIRQVVQTLGRFMAAYFSNHTVYIFPPHNPHPLPAIHFEQNILNNRILPKYHSEISARVRQQKLSSIWTVERALEYLLLSGLVCEAAWFAEQMGNWKTSFQLATACTVHQAMAPQLYAKPRRPLMLPESLQPDEILFRKLSQLVPPASPSGEAALVLIDDKTDVAQLTATLEDIMLAGVMGRVEVAPRLLLLLISRLKSVLQQLHPLVPADFYLPSPPLYCPQPAQSAKVGMTAAVQEETAIRRQASSLVQLTLAVMNAAHVSVPAFRWYIHQLALMQPKAVQFKSNTEGPCKNFPDILVEQLTLPSEFEKVGGKRSIHAVLTAFRDLCSLLWMMHARDKLSQSLRKREKFLSQMGYQGSEKSEWEGQEQKEWLSLCWSSLQWAAHLLSFTRFLPDEASVHKVLLSMLLELAPSVQVADLMAEFFHDSDNIHPELQERLDKILAEWQSIIVKPEEDAHAVRNSQESFDGRKSVTFHQASPRGESLSVYFLKQQQVAKRVLKKKVKAFGSYQEYTFAQGVDGPRKISVGSRPFETKVSYFDFLDMFCAVSFSKVLERLQTMDKASTLPLLNCLCGELLNQEMNYFVENVAAQAHKRPGLLILAGGSVSGSDHYASADDLAAEQRRAQHSSKKPIGLFRGRSILDYSPERYHAAVTRENADPNEQEPIYAERKYAYRKASPRQSRITEAASQWQLTVNFGKRYTHLQQLVEWLEVWSNKRHGFGLGRQEAQLELKPSMKIQIPAQLIVLSLWLLENKYSRSGAAPGDHDQGRGRQSRRGRRGDMLRKSASLSPRDLPMGGNKQVSPAGRTGRGRSRSKSGSRSPMRPVSEGMLEAGQAGRLEQSLPQSTLREAEEVRTAYEQVLDGPDDSSSLVVSSLASDELPNDLQRTQHALRGTESPSRGENSALNHTVYLERAQSPFERPPNPSPRPRSSTPTPSSHSRASASPVQRSASHNLDVPVGEGGLAQLLQQVIRKEMRRIVQIQQHSLAAMMGAIDGEDGGFSPPPLDRNQSGNSPDHRAQHRGQDRSIRHALSELHNLQQQTSGVQAGPQQERMTQHISAGPLHMSHLAMSQRGSDNIENVPPRFQGIPQFLRIPAEREQDGFRLPQIPIPQAWGPEPQVRGPEVPFPRLGEQSGFPLLRLAPGPPQPGVYAPPSQLPGASFLPPPPSYEQVSHPHPLSFGHVPPQPTLQRQDALESSGSLIGIPLLRMSQTGFPQTSQEPMFGRLVPPEYLTAHMEEQQRQEAAKRRHLEGFHEQLKTQRTEAEREAAVTQRELEQARALRQREREEMEEREVKEQVQQRRAARVAVKKRPVTAKKQAAKSPSPKPSSSAESARTTSLESEQSEKTEEQAEEEEGAEADELPEDATIHDGYAIPPGVFEGYEHLERELGAEADTDTRFQYKMAQAMRRQLEKEKERWLRQRMVDFSTNTKNYADAGVDVQRSFESIRTAEAATSVTRDTGVDPVHEAIAEYNRTRQGVAVPPDIFMGLRFADGEKAEDEVTRGRNRAFLNVVDVNASSILRDIPQRIQAQPDTDADIKPSAYSAQQTTPEEMGALEESLRAQFEPAVPRRGHDAVTVRLFERHAPGADKIAVALLPRDSKRDSKTNLVQRLRAMNDQMTAMDEMSRNIETGLHNSKLLLETLQSMNESYQPVPDFPPSQSMQMDRSEEFVSTQGTKLSVDTLTPKASAGSPSVSARRSARSPAARSPGLSDRSRQTEVSRSGEMSGRSALSGISDISDIIGEVLAEGGVDLKEAGLTEEEAKRLARSARNKRRPTSPQTSVDELKYAVEYAEQQKAQKSPEMKRREIHKWMTEKYTERQQQYIKQRSELAEREHSPYRPAATYQVDSRQCRTLEEEREQRRRERAHEDMVRRLVEAEYLIGSAMTDAIENNPEFIRSRSPSPRSPIKSRSPGSRSPKRSPKKSGRPATSTSPGKRAPMEKTFRLSSPPKGILKQTQSETSIGPSASQTQQVIQVRPAEESTEFEPTVESSTDLHDYMHAIQDMESSGEAASPPRRQPRPRRRPEPIPEKPKKVYKPKPFTEIVRMQRPEITRPQPAELPDEKYVKQVEADRARRKAESARSQAESARSKTSERRPSQRSVKALDKTRNAYAPMPKPTTPRRVKTYAERLQELKPKKRYATPIVPRQHIPESVSARSGRSTMMSQRRPTGPPHKPMTYVQQLQKINAEAGATKKPARRPGPQTPLKTRMPAHRAPHRPKTYTEQLQELNAPYKKTFRSTARGPPSRSSSRPRPYGDPYAVASEDALSVLSDWSVEDDVRRLIYEDEESSVGYMANGTEASYAIDHFAMPPSEAGASDYYDAIMGGSDHDLGMDYRDSVDVSELERIAEVASVGSGSVLSVIDWDAVDKLIEDV